MTERTLVRYGVDIAKAIDLNTLTNNTRVHCDVFHLI